MKVIQLKEGSSIKNPLKPVFHYDVIHQFKIII